MGVKITESKSYDLRPTTLPEPTETPKQITVTCIDDLAGVGVGATVQQEREKKEVEDFSLDDILKQIGQCGLFQYRVFLLAGLAMAFNAAASITYIFTASSVVHRCNITECDTVWSAYDEHWTQYSIPMENNELDKCNRFASNYINNQSNITTLPPSSDDNESLGLCYRHNFDSEKIESCPNNDFIFRDKEVTISNEFGIYCKDDWKLALVGTIGNAGQFIGIPLGGIISDRFGRRTALVVCGTASFAFGLIRSFAPNYVWFVVFEFLDNIANSSLYPISFILAIEFVGPQLRILATTLITMLYVMGEIALALVAKYYQNWRLILRIVYIPAVIIVTYVFILPESVRWLLSQSKEKEAKRELKRAASGNKRKLSEASWAKLVVANRGKLAATTAAVHSRFPLQEAFHKLFWRILNCSFCWVVNVLVFYGISLNSVLLDGDKYNNFIFISLMEIPGFGLPYLILDRFGRRYSLFCTMILSGISCLLTALLPKDYLIWRLAFFLMGKLMISCAFQVLYYFTSEIFPTNVRNTLLAFCSMVGRVGSVLAPQTPLLAKYHEKAPAVLFAACAITSGTLSLLFPETTNTILPTTVNDARNIGIKSKKRNKQKFNC